MSTARQLKRQTRQSRFAVCSENGGHDDLVPRKLYQVLPDGRAAGEGLLRVVDESGEDYLYPADLFTFVDLPHKAERMLMAAA